MKIPGVVPRLSDTPGETRWLGPKLGEHTAQVLTRLGYSDARQQALKAGGVI
jgi:formyl-CoA transferase